MRTSATSTHRIPRPRASPRSTSIAFDQIGLGVRSPLDRPAGA